MSEQLRKTLLLLACLCACSARLADALAIVTVLLLLSGVNVADVSVEEEYRCFRLPNSEVRDAGMVVSDPNARDEKTARTSRNCDRDLPVSTQIIKVQTREMRCSWALR